MLTGEPDSSTVSWEILPSSALLSRCGMSWMFCQSADMHHSAVEDLSLQVALREKRYFKAAVQAGDHSPEACQQLKVLESHGDQV